MFSDEKKKFLLIIFFFCISGKTQPGNALNNETIFQLDENHQLVKSIEFSFELDHNNNKY